MSDRSYSRFFSYDVEVKARVLVDRACHRGVPVGRLPLYHHFALVRLASLALLPSCPLALLPSCPLLSRLQHSFIILHLVLNRHKH
jgi:hypothetical protein